MSIQDITGGPKWPTHLIYKAIARHSWWLRGPAHGPAAPQSDYLGSMANFTPVLPPTTPAAGRDFDHALGNSAAGTLFHCLGVADWPIHFAWQSQWCIVWRMKWHRAQMAAIFADCLPAEPCNLTASLALPQRPAGRAKGPQTQGGFQALP